MHMTNSQFPSLLQKSCVCANRLRCKEKSSCNLRIECCAQAIILILLSTLIKKIAVQTEAWLTVFAEKILFTLSQTNLNFELLEIEMKICIGSC